MHGPEVDQGPGGEPAERSEISENLEVFRDLAGLLTSQPSRCENERKLVFTKVAFSLRC